MPSIDLLASLFARCEGAKRRAHFHFEPLQVASRLLLVRGLKSVWCVVPVYLVQDRLSEFRQAVCGRVFGPELDFLRPLRIFTSVQFFIFKVQV